MPRRPRRGALGLRGRIVGVVIVTTAATLAVAALALLGPLEQSLRNAEQNTLKYELRGATSNFSGLNPADQILQYVPVPSGGAGLSPAQRETQQALQEQRNAGLSVNSKLFHQQESLGSRIGASEVTLLGYADPATGHDAKQVVVWPSDADLAQADPYDDAARVFRSNQPLYSFGSIDGTDYVRAALPINTRAPTARWVLVVRKPLTEVGGAVAAVGNAFLTAALAGAALTLLLGIPLSARIVRRLLRLRHAALRLAEGGPTVAVPVDRARDEVGDLTRAFGIMQLRLQQQEEARRAFVSTASHELRTPVASLDGMLELLAEDLQSGDPDLEDARAVLERARVQSRRLGRLAADLLDLSRIDAQVQLRSEPVELGELSRAVLAEFELGTSAREIVTELDDSTGPVWALGDPGSVARIVRILLDNAVRLSPDQGQVTVELRNGEQASLTVRDEGPGVPADERELIFQRFQRGRAASGNAGFGLGLAIGRELAARMGGELVLEATDAPGAKFTLRLPLARAPEEEPLVVG